MLGNPGEPSEQVSWDDVVAAQAEVAVVMPCGYDAARAYEEATEYRERLGSIGARRIVAVDASSYFSRPSLRLVEGLELLAHVLHPREVPEPAAGGAAIELELADLEV
jgi:iron complex transport system substrate-binding protein